VKVIVLGIFVAVKTSTVCHQ